MLRAISVSKRSPDHLIAAGLGGTVLRSTDAGETWCQLSPTSVDLFAAEAVGDTEFLVGGAGGLLLRTTNGGGPCRDISAVPPGAPPGRGVRPEGPLPQPSRGRAGFVLRARPGGSFRVEAFDAAGRVVAAPPVVRTGSEGRTTITLDTQGWSPGVYLVRAWGREGGGGGSWWRSEGGSGSCRRTDRRCAVG